MRTAALILAACLTATPAAAQQEPPGTALEVTPGDLPEPYASESVANSPRRIARPEGARPAVPEGFRANLFAGGLDHARWLAVAPGGDVFLAEPGPGRITVLRDADGDGRAERKATFASGFSRPHGLAFHGGHLYMADTEAVWRFDYAPGQLEGGEPVKLTPDGALGGGSGHWTRNVAVHPDGSRLYVAIGSRGNIGEEPTPRATVQEFAVDGSDQRTFADGLRNPVGIAFRPGTEELWVVVNERDGLGDGLVPDYLTAVREGGFYGWPYSYIGAHPQPGYAERRPDLVERAIVPDLLFQSHSAPLGLVFYEAEAFPESYRGDAFVALHGSWNRAEPTGYKVVHAPFEDGRPVGHYVNFATGFWARGTDTAEVWGRPVGLAVAADGSLLVADDVGQAVWRIAYTGE